MFPNEGAQSVFDNLKPVNWQADYLGMTVDTIYPDELGMYGIDRVQWISIISPVLNCGVKDLPYAVMLQNKYRSNAYVF